MPSLDVRFFCQRYGVQRELHSFPTRRSSDLADGWLPLFFVPERTQEAFGAALAAGQAKRDPALGPLERSEGTRLNSSHVEISYAVFCLKKKTNAYGCAVREDKYRVAYACNTR